MKKFLLIASLLIAGSSFASPLNSTPVSGSITIKGAEEKVAVQTEQLPEGVIKTLDGAKFTGWKPILAYRIQNDTTKYYEITFVRGEEVITLKLNENGGKIG